MRHTQFENWSSRESNFGESTNSTTVYNVHRVSRRISWRDWTSHPIQPAVTTYIFSKIEFGEELFGENRRFNQFNQQLQHTYFSKIKFCEKLFLRGLAIQPIQPLDATSMFWIEPLDEIVGKELKVNHFNSVGDKHNLKIGVRENLIFGESTNSTTVYNIHIFENRVSRRISWLDWTSHPIQPTYLQKSSLRGIIWRESTIQPFQPPVATHIFFEN